MPIPIATRAATTIPVHRHALWCVDRSGSMQQAGTNAMYNSVKTLVEQAKTIPNTFATIITFDEAINVPVDKIPVAEVTNDNLRPDDFQPRGQTSLYDPIMLCFDKINNQNDAKQDGEKL